ncbi:hypothetical protein COOONC_07547 [Cooperia oncophora]
MYGSDDLFEFLHRKWEIEVYQTERERIWIAMGASKKKEHIHRIFDDLFFNSAPSDLRPMCAGYVRIFDDLFFNSAPSDLRPMCAGYVSYNHPLNHFTSYVLENLDRITKAVLADRIPIDLLFQTFARGIVKVEDIPTFNMVVERFAQDVPPKLAAMMSARIRSVSVWMKTHGDSVINNATVIMGQVRRSSSKPVPDMGLRAVNGSVHQLLIVGSRRVGHWH